MRAILLVFCFLPLVAEANFARDFLQSFQREVFWIDHGRFQQTADRIHLAQPSLLERWGVINNDAAASYNSFLNTIILKPESISRDGNGNLRIATLPELRERHPAPSVVIATIFHEIAHGEYDVFVEKGATPEDERLYRMLQQEVLPWIQRRHPGLSFFSQRIAVWEIFGYFRGDLMQLIQDDRDEILSANGFFRNKCFFSPALKQAALDLSQEEFMRLLPMHEDLDRPYSDRFRLDLVWAMGNEVELYEKGFDPFLPEWKAGLFRHFRAFYRIPRDRRELLDRMNHALPEAFTECRKAYWNSVR